MSFSCSFFFVFYSFKLDNLYKKFILHHFLDLLFWFLAELILLRFIVALHRITMTSPSHSLCMIPGPVEFDQDVLNACATMATSHVDPAFIGRFSRALKNLRNIFLAAPDAQPFIIAGSGTLGWDMTAANLVQPNDAVLVVNTGYFGDSFADCLTVYGASVTHVRAARVGSRPSLHQLRHALQEAKLNHVVYKLVTITHVDTSTGVLTDIKHMAAVIREVSPESLIVVDGVCSVAAEELRMQEWDLDVVLTASQKAIGVPPGLSILVASSRAMNVFHQRTHPVQSYYASWTKWLPIMQNYEHQKGSYFATPPVQLVMALDVALEQVLAYGMDKVFEQHRTVNAHVKATLKSWGLKLVATEDEFAANTLSAVYLPENVTAMDLLPKLKALGVVAAGGLHRDIASKYFRLGHMGVMTVMKEDQLHYVEKTLQALAKAFNQCGYVAAKL